jgi:hypothetical protein
MSYPPKSGSKQEFSTYLHILRSRRSSDSRPVLLDERSLEVESERLGTPLGHVNTPTDVGT